MQVFLSESAEYALMELSDYLTKRWGTASRDKFIEKLKLKLKQISLIPDSCPKSGKVNNLYKCVLTKQTTLFYRINSKQNEIEIVSIFDTRQNPEKRPDS